MRMIYAENGVPAKAGTKLESTHHGNQEFLHLLNSSLHLHGGSVFGVLHCDQNMQLIVQMLPVWLSSIQLLLQRNKRQQVLIT